MHSLKSIASAAAAFAAIASCAEDAAVAPRSDSGKPDGCALLQSHLGQETFFPGSSVYEYENLYFWSQTEYKTPSCVFRPKSAQDLSKGLGLVESAQELFAVRGGGHMGIPGFNNIDDGVLMVMSNISTLSLSQDKSIVSIGPSKRWEDVYAFLEPYGLAVSGGRLAPIGVPGLTLGGGIGFYGNQVGFTADTVVNYEVVLADGSIVNVNKDNYPDLNWALKGGSSNFGIVTRFDIQTLESPKVWAGIYSVASASVPDYLNAIAEYSYNTTDAKSHIVPAVVAENGTEQIGAVIIYYDSPDVSYPPSLKPFTDIPALSNSLNFTTLYQFTQVTGAEVIPNIRDQFTGGTFVGHTKEQLFTGLNISNSIFFERLPILYSQLPVANRVTFEIDWEPIGQLWIDASNARGGNALALNASKGNYMCYAMVAEWTGAQYDLVINNWMQETKWKIDNATQAAGIHDPFNYMGDASGFEPMFSGYGEGESEAKLHAISLKYDPKRVFQKLMPGGFKVGV